MNINIDDLKKLMSQAFDHGRTSYGQTKEDYINKTIEDYLYINEQSPQITLTASKNIQNDYYSYYAYSCGLDSNLDTNDFI
jgi:hypothetical protein